MTVLAWIVIATLISGVASVIAASALLLLPTAMRTKLQPHLVSFATGALLGAALLALIPHAVLGAGFMRVHQIGLALVGGVGLFFVLEKFLLWRHCHDEHCDEHGELTQHAHDRNRDQVAGPLVLVGDALHNTLDGVLVAAAFLTDVDLGIVTALAIMAHEIPQEVGNFAVLLHAGMSRGRALFWNLVTSLTAVLGGLLGYFALRTAMFLLPYALAIAAASMLYIAVADLIPGLHRRVDPRSSVAQIVLITIGIAVVALAERHAH
ncbi:MAG: ZIP family metal transporter [Pseudomonadales bacterium]|nr:ZIP family metal transporter [Pseudomonadales bacterium]